MKSYLIAYSSAVVTFLLVDGLWLAMIAKPFYVSQLGDLLRKNVLLLPAGLFYLVYTAGIVFLAVRPTHTDLSLLNVALHGALVGFLAYGTYDMTNLATLRNWPAALSVVDTLWGTALSATVATVSAVSVRYFT